MSNIFEAADQFEKVSTRSALNTPVRRSSVDIRSVSPLPEKKAEFSYESKTNPKSYSEIPPPVTPLRRASVDVRPVSPLPDRRAESHFDSKLDGKGFDVPPPTPPPPPPPLPPSKSQMELKPPISPLPERKTDSSSGVSRGEPPARVI